MPSRQYNQAHVKHAHLGLGGFHRFFQTCFGRTLRFNSRLGPLNKRFGRLANSICRSLFCFVTVTTSMYDIVCGVSETKRTRNRAALEYR